jgi:CBS domain-containing protein
MTMTNVGAMPVSALAADGLARVAPDVDMWELAEALVDADVGALAVGDDDEMLGVVSERDIVRALAVRRDPSRTRAIDLAHTRLVWCDASSTVAEVAEEMMEHYVRHVLVEDGGRVVGMVSARDLLGAYAAADLAGFSDDDADDDVA